MKILQRKILILVICSILFSAFVVMIIAFSNYTRIMESDSGQIMQLLCSEKRQTIDEELMNIEQSVKIIYHFAKEQLGKVDNLSEKETELLEHMNRMEELMNTTARYTEGVVSVYYRLVPEIEEATHGLWLVKDEKGEFVNHEITVISDYDKDDIEHVGWYYIPIENRKETWLNPYYNKNINEEIISYVIPIIIDEEVYGIVGMDISTSLLYDNTKSVTVYNEGYAFLMDNEGRFVYHPDMDNQGVTDEFDYQHAYLYEKSLLAAENKRVVDYHWDGYEKKMTAQKLHNGMIFTVCVTDEELEAPQKDMLQDTMIVILIILSLFVLATVSITKAIVRLMYTDSMNRVRNKTAYAECVDMLSKRIEEKHKVDFVIIVVDINDLKKVNDTYGHDHGDILIQNGASILKKIWDAKCVYRIGGDEFVILDSTMNKDKAESKIALFEETINEYNQRNNAKELYLQMAIGMSVYDPNEDKEYMDVFRRADSAMYEDKKRKKNAIS